MNNSIKTIVESSLPVVSEIDGIISFPPFNFSLNLNSSDAPYFILDTYILAVRCASFTPMTPEQVSEMSNELIGRLKSKVMPFVPIRNFEKAHKNMMSMVLNMPGKVKSSLDGQESSKDPGRDAIDMRDFKDQTPSFAENVPIYLKFQYDFNLVSTKPPPTVEFSTAVGNDAKLEKEELLTEGYSNHNHFIRAQLMDDKITTTDQPAIVVVQDQGGQPEQCYKDCDPESESKISYFAVACVVGVFMVCCSIALVVYCLLSCCNGCKSGSQTSSDRDPDECNELELCLEDYAKNHSRDSACRCHCSLTDTNQLDIIASLHSRCEQLSKKISQVVTELSQENVFEKQAPFDKLRNFVRQVSLEMVNEEEMLQKLIKLQESKMKLHAMK
ncbi:Hypothetical protein NTJ_00573 [Nesidiocoris tenuis]|uniref:SEA domain-containing protein n=1 Tax=Nesidiocoris tenuis TaxID=355587 RepID=A0ABN7A959_9HEMI|nr:Hypothetical protein NTJ_00573 [Nesidiocoris tenuis]